MKFLVMSKGSAEVNACIVKVCKAKCTCYSPTGGYRM